MSLAQNPVFAEAPNNLGKYAKSIHHAGNEASPLPDIDRDLTRAQREKQRRFKLLEGAQRLLYRAGESWKDLHRVCGCHRHMTDDTGITIKRRKDGKGARFEGVATCGSIWACPVCSEKISAERREEIQFAHAAWRKQGGEAYLLTLTYPHRRSAYSLTEYIERLDKARQSFQNSKTYKGLKIDWGRIGQINALEVTWGEHGWHPHLHVVYFAQSGLNDRETVRQGEGGASKGFLDWHDDTQRLVCAWVDAVIKAGLAEESQRSAMLLHSVDFRGGEYVAQYAAKFGREPEPTNKAIEVTKQRWGLASEATRWAAKVGHGQRGDYIGLTPFGLLADALENDDSESAALYRDYVETFTGKRQLTWSPGLKKRFGVDDLTDEEMSVKPPKAEEEFCIRLDIDDWRAILRHHRRGSVYSVLHWAALLGRDGVEAMLEVCRETAPSNKGEFNVLAKYQDRFNPVWMH